MKDGIQKQKPGPRLVAQEVASLFSICLDTFGPLKGPELVQTLIAADGSARDRTAGFLTALASAAGGVPHARATRQARALLGRLYEAAPTEEPIDTSGEGNPV